MFHESDKYKGIAIRTVCKRVKDPKQDRPPSKNIHIIKTKI